MKAIESASHYMRIKIPLALLVCACAIAQQPPPMPLNLRLTTAETTPTNIVYLTVTMGTNNPLALAHQGVAAYWQMPSAPVVAFGGAISGVWMPEVSTNGSNWQTPGNQFSQILPRAQRIATNWCLDCWNYTETGAEQSNWQVRIRKQ